MKNANMRKPLRTLTLLLLITLLTAGLANEAEAASYRFPDVAKSAYYYTPVNWAVDEGITVGRGGYFQPDKTCTRAEAVTFLYNLAKKPGITGGSSFVDVQDRSVWYYDAVCWAIENNLTVGFGTKNGQPAFRPEVTCSRAMIVTLLKNYADYVAGNYTPASVSGEPFPDVKAGSWYFDTVAWAAENHITSGKGDGKFHPDDPCTRAQIVTFIYNYRQLEGSDHVHNWVRRTVNIAAWDEQVLVKPAWTEQVLVKEAWSEEVLVKEAWHETVLVEAAWDEPVYDEFCVCAKCGYMTQNVSDIIFHCADAHESEGGASYSVEWLQVGTVHHDDVYETVEHPAEYETIEHPAEYEMVVHPAEYTTVHHDAVTHTVTCCTSCGATK